MRRRTAAGFATLACLTLVVATLAADSSTAEGESGLTVGPDFGGPTLFGELGFHDIAHHSGELYDTTD